MIDRREFLRIASLAAAWPSGVVVNDIHSQLNATRVHRVVEPHTLDAVRSALSTARRERRAICIAGGRHAMGAQAFATDGVLIDIRKLNHVAAALPAELWRQQIRAESRGFRKACLFRTARSSRNI